jgi:hypothetical protein
MAIAIFFSYKNTAMKKAERGDVPSYAHPLVLPHHWGCHLLDLLGYPAPETIDLTGDKEYRPKSDEAERHKLPCRPIEQRHDQTYQVNALPTNFIG